SRSNRSGRSFGRRWIADNAPFVLMALRPRTASMGSVLASVIRDKRLREIGDAILMCLKRGKLQRDDPANETMGASCQTRGARRLSGGARSPPALVRQGVGVLRCGLCALAH